MKLFKKFSLFQFISFLFSYSRGGGMKKLLLLSSLVLTTLVWGQEKYLIDNLVDEKAQWVMFGDDVMGGLSKGKLSELKEEEISFYRLEGDVSTANNGGFIQFRTSVKLQGTTYEGIRIKVRGNNNKYFIHLRTGATVFPWDYYDISFEASDEWQNINLPFSKFKKSRRLLPSKVNSSRIKSIGLVAYGKDFEAELDLASIELY